jgi:hypothetical protein
LRWNGAPWKQAANSGPRGGFLDAVTATSATNAWAVGTTGRNGRFLILHWKGSTWK